MSAVVAFGPLGITALCSAIFLFPAVASGQASVAMFGDRSLNMTSFSEGVRRTSSGDFTLVELNATVPSAGTSPEGREAASVLSCTALASPPLRPSLAPPTAARRQLYWPLVRAAECRHGLPAGLLDALVLMESQYQAGAVSWAGAGGLTQLMPATASSLGVSDRFNAAHNIDGGARYLRQMIKTFSGSVSLALAAYNAGPGAVRRSGGIPLNGETPGYVERVLAYWREQAGSDARTSMSARRMAEVLGFLAQNRTTPAAGRLTLALEER
jgi:hypothetical protein